MAPVSPAPSTGRICRSLAEVIETIASSPAKPKQIFQLATNGTLLKRHDLERCVKAGLNRVVISIDTFDDQTLRHLRGTTPSIIKSNIALLRQHPTVEICLTAVVTKANIGQVPEFITTALEFGIHKFNFYEIFFAPESNLLDNKIMRSLLLDDGQFYSLKQETLNNFGEKAEFIFAHDAFLRRVHIGCGMDETVTTISREHDLPASGSDVR
jgi:MoaA/NifB/PqqE/SkfB family radical SAM enzyme